MQILKIFRRDRTFKQPAIWVTILFMVLFHAGALAAPFAFSWKALVVSVLLWWIAGSLGIGMGYHRLLTHRGFKTFKWMEYILAVCGTLALEGGPLLWVATHRLHHQNTDKEGDPHSPHDGGFWAHMGWVLTGQTMQKNSAALLPYVPELRKDRFHMFISRWHWMPIAILAGLLFLIGGWRCVLWGIFLRAVVGLHSTWLVNSATHMWGRQRFQTQDDSRNSFWVALLTFGEGWHNNHHAYPQSARHGMAWYEFDPNWYGILVLRILGLAWDLKTKTLNYGEAKAARTVYARKTGTLIFRSDTEPANEVKRCLTLRGASTGKFRIPAANLQKAASWFIGEAVLFLILGISAILAPAVAEVAVISLIGWLLTLGGVAHLSIMVSGVGAARLIWQVIHGTIYAIAGIYLLIHPPISNGMLTLLLSTLFLAEGVLEFIAYFRTRNESGSVWLLVNGLVTLLLGGLISIHWPSNSGWSIRALVGANLFMRGLSRLMSSMAAQRCVLNSGSPI